MTLKVLRSNGLLALTFPFPAFCFCFGGNFLPPRFSIGIGDGMGLPSFLASGIGDGMGLPSFLARRFAFNLALELSNLLNHIKNIINDKVNSLTHKRWNTNRHAHTDLILGNNHTKTLKILTNNLNNRTRHRWSYTQRKQDLRNYPNLKLIGQDPFERIHLSFLKWTLNVNKTTSNAAI